MHRRGKFLFFAGLMFALFFNLQNVFAYDHSIAHPGIADLAVKLYNSQNEIQITAQQVEYILQGSNNEDSPVRWFNHFYDPIYNIGFSDFVFGEKLGIFPTAPVWLQSPYDQIQYSVGDRSWQRAIDDYARGDEEKAFLGLGHAIHLISDMSVPAHTRNSAHPGDSYESFVKSNWSSIAPNLNYEFREINSLQQAFTDLANYSNNNFYSDRTIKNNKYSIVNIIENNLIQNNNGLFYRYYFSKINNKQYKIFVNKNPLKWNDEEIYELDDYLVLTDYSQTLIPQAVSYSSGLIKLFLQEAEAKKSQLQYEKMSWWQKINNVLFNDDLPIVRQTVEGYVMEKTLAPAIEFGGDVLDKAKEIKETVEKIAQKNQEPEVYEKIIPEAKAEEEKTIIISSTTFTTPTTLITTTTSYYSSGGGSSYVPPTVEPTTTPEINLDLETPSPELFLELFQTTTSNFITLNFSSSETSSLPVSFEGKHSTSTFWNSLFSWTTSTLYIFETNKSGEYNFRVRAIDGVYNTSTWTEMSVTVPQRECIYSYLTGEQEDDEVVLTPDSSPYLLDYYYVSPGKKLIIEPGTVIKSLSYEDGENIFAYANLDVAGELEILGTSENKVIFTSVYDNSFENECLNTLSLATSSEQVMGGILIGVFDTTVDLKNFEMRQFDRPQPHVQLASFGGFYNDYIYPTNECIIVENSAINITGAVFKGCGGEGALQIKNSQVTIKNSQIISDLNAYDNGVVVEGGDLFLDTVKISGYREYPLKILAEANFQFIDLSLENNRVNAILNPELKGDLNLKKDENFWVLNRDILNSLSSFTVDPGASFYYEGMDGISSNKNLSLIGTPEDRIKIYLPNIYESAMSFNGTTNIFKYVDFVGLEPYLNTGLKDSYGVENSWGLVLSDSYRREILNFSKRRSQGLIIRNGNLVLENVRFFNSFIPWSVALNLYNSTSSLKEVSFITIKPYGEIFYLEEAENLGINGDGGIVDLDNVNFADLFCGIHSDPDYYYGLIKTVTTNMSAGNFENVIYNFVPEDLIIFSVPEEEVTSTPEGEGGLVE